MIFKVNIYLTPRHKSRGLMGYASLSFDDGKYIINNFRIVEKDNIIDVYFPSVKHNINGKDIYINIFYPTDVKDRHDIKDLILNTYWEYINKKTLDKGGKINL